MGTWVAIKGSDGSAKGLGRGCAKHDRWVHSPMLKPGGLRVGTDCSGIEAPIHALKARGIPHRHSWSSEVAAAPRKVLLAAREFPTCGSYVSRRSSKFQGQCPVCPLICTRLQWCLDLFTISSMFDQNAVLVTIVLLCVAWDGHHVTDEGWWLPVYVHKGDL